MIEILVIHSIYFNFFKLFLLKNDVKIKQAIEKKFNLQLCFLFRKKNWKRFLYKH